MGGFPRSIVLAVLLALALAPPPAASNAPVATDGTGSGARWIAYDAEIPAGGRVVLTITLDGAELPAHVGGFIGPSSSTGPRFLYVALVTDDATPTGTFVRTSGTLPLGAMINLHRSASDAEGEITLVFEYQNEGPGDVRRHLAAWAGSHADAGTHEWTAAAHDGATLLAQAEGADVHLITQEDFARGVEARADPVADAPGANVLLDGRASLDAVHPFYGVFWQEPATRTCAGATCAPTSAAALSHRAPNGASSGPREAILLFPGAAGTHEFTAHAWLAARQDGTPLTTASERGHLVVMGAALDLPTA